MMRNRKYFTFGAIVLGIVSSISFWLFHDHKREQVIDDYNSEISEYVSLEDITDNNVTVDDTTVSFYDVATLNEDGVYEISEEDIGKVDIEAVPNGTIIILEDGSTSIVASDSMSDMSNNK